MLKAESKAYESERSLKGSSDEEEVVVVVVVVEVLVMEYRNIVLSVGRATLDNRSLSTAEIPTKDDDEDEEDDDDDEDDDDPASIFSSVSLPLPPSS